LLSEFLPLDNVPAVEGARLEQQVVASQPAASAAAAQAIAVSIDGDSEPTAAYRNWSMRGYCS
jgi:hypothetical protein